MTPDEAFFTVHSGLDREGPGEAADVLWALDVARTPAKARILDAGCGPGADTATLARSRPGADILAIDLAPSLAETARRRLAPFRPRVTVVEGDYLHPDGSFDLIWCAGAVYFRGIAAVLDAWRDRLSPGGAVAFSEPAWMIEPPSDAARAFWESEYEVMTQARIESAIHEAGWGVLGRRWVVDAPWAAYYGSLSARLDRLEETEQPLEVETIIAATRGEITRWQAAREEIAYGLFVVRPA